MLRVYLCPPLSVELLCTLRITEFTSTEAGQGQVLQAEEGSQGNSVEAVEDSLVEAGLGSLVEVELEDILGQEEGSQGRLAAGGSPGVGSLEELVGSTAAVVAEGSLVHHYSGDCTGYNPWA